MKQKRETFNQFVGILKNIESHRNTKEHERTFTPAATSGGAPATPAFVSTPQSAAKPGGGGGGPGSAASVSNFSASVISSDVPVAPSEESIDIQRVSIGAKLGRELKAFCFVL